MATCWFRGHPTRAALLAEIAADDELVDVFGHDLPAHVRALHEALENTCASQISWYRGASAEGVKEATPRLAHYAEPWLAWLSLGSWPNRPRLLRGDFGQLRAARRAFICRPMMLKN